VIIIMTVDDLGRLARRRYHRPIKIRRFSQVFERIIQKKKNKATYKVTIYRQRGMGRPDGDNRVGRGVADNNNNEKEKNGAAAAASVA